MVFKLSRFEFLDSIDSALHAFLFKTQKKFVVETEISVAKKLYTAPTFSRIQFLGFSFLPRSKDSSVLSFECDSVPF